jgi:hypothetical protein
MKKSKNPLWLEKAIMSLVVERLNKIIDNWRNDFEKILPKNDRGNIISS